MKKIISIFSIILLLMITVISGHTYAASLNKINIKTSKTKVKPGEEVTVTIEFGQKLGAYTFDIAYDNKIFDYVSANGGTASDKDNKVIVVYHDATGGTKPRTNMSVKFKAKSNLKTSNPTEFTITGNGLANADATVTYDDIKTPIVKNVTVEPKYVGYTLKVDYKGEIIKNKEKDMTISYSSSMGHSYEHARLVATVEGPKGGNVQILATDEEGLEHDIIDSGWGDAQGFKLGGKNVAQVLKTRAKFSKAGEYKITLKLIDRDNSDKTIAKKEFKFKVLERATDVDKTKKETKSKRKELPKAGINMYIPAVLILTSLITAYIVCNSKK